MLADDHGRIAAPGKKSRFFVGLGRARYVACPFVTLDDCGLSGEYWRCLARVGRAQIAIGADVAQHVPLCEESYNNY